VNWRSRNQIWNWLSRQNAYLPSISRFLSIVYGANSIPANLWDRINVSEIPLWRATYFVIFVKLIYIYILIWGKRFIVIIKAAHIKIKLNPIKTRSMLDWDFRDSNSTWTSHERKRRLVFAPRLITAALIIGLREEASDTTRCRVSGMREERVCASALRDLRKRLDRDSIRRAWASEATRPIPSHPILSRSVPSRRFDETRVAIASFACRGLRTRVRVGYTRVHTTHSRVCRPRLLAPQRENCNATPITSSYAVIDTSTLLNHGPFFPGVSAFGLSYPSILGRVRILNFFHSASCRRYGNCFANQVAKEVRGRDSTLERWCNIRTLEIYSSILQW